jgi:peptidoglycan hydrolase-like protein with peptidoglycan-binding domain
MPTITSPNRYEGRAAPIRVIVLHTMETEERSDIAEAVASYFSRTSTRASAHLCVDNDSTVRCVDDQDTAWAAPGANADGLQIEIAGRASQNPTQWADAYSKDLLDRAAAEVAAWCKRWNIPARLLTDAQLADGFTRGITTHAAVSRVFRRSDHTDPGKDFPAGAFVAAVAAKAGQVPPAVVKITKPPKTTVTKGLVVDGIAGPRTVARWQQVMGTVVDGVISRPSLLVRAVQRRVGTPQDGLLGPVTWRAIQRRLGVPADGIPGPITITALQRRLNTGKF